VVICIFTWFNAVGEDIREGDNLFEVETDKVTVDVQAIVCGRLGEIRVGAGSVAKVGDVIAVVDTVAAAAGGGTDCVIRKLVAHNVYCVMLTVRSHPLSPKRLCIKIVISLPPNVRQNITRVFVGDFPNTFLGRIDRRIKLLPILHQVIFRGGYATRR
jgi:pyruvate/2-oxoglutarate dehydrogenase complex dihydrolipoamide acyltransferase (E2) component